MTTADGRPPGDDVTFTDDAALDRLEDVIFGLPSDRVLPDLDDLLARAKMSTAQVIEDARVAALLQRAISSRPWSGAGERDAVRVQVSLLELELDVLIEQLDDRDPATARDVTARLVTIRAQVDELLGRL